MQSEFQNKVVLTKQTREVHFITSLNIFSVAHLYFGPSLIRTRVPSQFLRISDVLLYNEIIIIIIFNIYIFQNHKYLSQAGINARPLS
jgi:hypothetical protein